LTPGPSFDHNLCYKCPNGSCKAILDIYTSRPFQRYKERFNARCFDPCNCTLSFWESQRTPESRRTPKSHFRECEWRPHTSLKVGLRQVGIIWFSTSILVELGIVETPIHGLTIYSFQILYGSTLVQLITFCDENPISILGNLSIHMLVSFFVNNSKACDSMFSQFVMYALLLSKLYINFYKKNWFVFHACCMSHSMWNGHL